MGQFFPSKQMSKIISTNNFYLYFLINCTSVNCSPENTCCFLLFSYAQTKLAHFHGVRRCLSDDPFLLNNRIPTDILPKLEKYRSIFRWGKTDATKWKNVTENFTQQTGSVRLCAVFIE